MIFDAFECIKKRCEEHGVKFATALDEQNCRYMVYFKKDDWCTEMGIDLYVPFDVIINKVNERLDEFLADLERGAEDVS